ncbi:MAG: multiheme c-type cytochrome [Acidobacteriota bacterium]|nr:multiheme c-type cytochrome [Acidobacteriota bacterium]
MKRHLSTTASLALCLALWSLAPPSRAGDPAATPCTACHDQIVASFESSPHGKLATEPGLDPAGACSACHGPAEQHMEEADPTRIRSFPGKEREADAELCLGCHASRNGMGAWQAGEHAIAGVSCLDCHSIHDLGDEPSPGLGRRHGGDPLRELCPLPRRGTGQDADALPSPSRRRSPDLRVLP